MNGIPNIWLLSVKGIFKAIFLYNICVLFILTVFIAYLHFLTPALRQGPMNLGLSVWMFVCLWVQPFVYP